MDDPKPVTSIDLKNIFKGHNFTRRLSQAVNESLKYSDETQFNIVRTLVGDEIIYGDVTSSTDLMDDPGSSTGGFFTSGIEEIIKNKGLDILRNEVFPLIVYHTHPNPTYLGPSPEDLFDMAQLRLCTYEAEYGIPYDNTPLFVIGSMPEKNIVELLILQEKGIKPMGGFLAQQIIESIETAENYDPNDNHIISKLLNSRPELNATLLTYNRNNRGKYTTSDEELKKLERFAYSPILL